MSSDSIIDTATEQRVLAHMNSDHADSLLRYAQALAAMPDASSAKLCALTADSLELEARTRA